MDGLQSQGLNAKPGEEVRGGSSFVQTGETKGIRGGERGGRNRDRGLRKSFD